MKFLLLICNVAILSTCATIPQANQDDAKQALLADVYNTVYDGAANYTNSVMQGQNGQDAAEAAFIAAGTKNGIAAIGTLLKDYAGPGISALAQKINAAVSKANPKTPADQTAVLNTVGAALQTVANQST